MFSNYRHPVALAALMVGLVVATPVLAQTNPSPPPAADAPGGWDNETFEHQEYREEMAQIRKEHEDIENARDRLMDKCVNVSREQADACNKERQELRDRQAKLHDRVHALHEKMRAAHHDASPAPQAPQK